jgi:hypothetical protein
MMCITDKTQSVEDLKGMCVACDIKISADTVQTEMEKEQEDRVDPELAVAAFKRQSAAPSH